MSSVDLAVIIEFILKDYFKSKVINYKSGNYIR